MQFSPSFSTAGVAASAPPLRLQLQGVTKQYPCVRANHNVALALQAGEIHAVLGENGAGKSTLMKIIYGAVQPDSGQIQIDGQVVHIHNPQQARHLGIAMVFQHFSLFDTLSVAENVWLGLDQSESLAQLTRRIAEKAAEYGLDIDPLRPVHTLSVGEMQRVEIIRALLTQPRVLILDEPTSVLTPQAVQKLFVVLRRLASEGCSILYISHKLHEIRALCSACTVLRAGEVTGVCDPRTQTDASLSRLMIGAEPPALEHREHAPGEVVLDVRELTLLRAEPFGIDLRDIDVQVRAGEIVGLAGVSGNGQKELLCALSGEDRRAHADQVCMTPSAGASPVPIAHLGPRERRRLGLHFVPEERLGRGAVPGMSLAHNLLLTRSDALGAGGFIQMRQLQEQARAIIARFGVKAGGPQAPAQSLSGGNLQKFIVGRKIEALPRLLIVSQPTWGVDVGAAAQIHAELLKLRDAGCAVLLLSEELDELFDLSDRLHVIARGHVSPSVARSEASMERIGQWMSGLWHADVQAHLAQMQERPVQEAAHAAA